MRPQNASAETLIAEQISTRKKLPTFITPNTKYHNKTKPVDAQNFMLIANKNIINTVIFPDHLSSLHSVIISSEMF